MADKKARDEEDQKTEGGLRGDQRVHQAAARVRIVTAFERAGRLDSRGPERGRETEQESPRG